jgi:hypothetical protein
MSVICLTSFVAPSILGLLGTFFRALITDSRDSVRILIAPIVASQSVGDDIYDDTYMYLPP